jgi:hypothetical protein
MTEENNVTALNTESDAEDRNSGSAQREALRELWDGLKVDPRYTASEPSIRAAVMLGGVVATGAKSPSLLGVLEGEEEAGLNFAVFFLAAMDNPKTQDGIYHVLAEMWDRDVLNEEIAEPIDDWEYEPTEQQVKEGLPPREERWRMYSRKTRKRMLKRYEVEELPFIALLSFAKSLTEREIADFFTLLYSVVREKLESSSTESNDATPSGPTTE